jgi:hypothetical protein
MIWVYAERTPRRKPEENRTREGKSRGPGNGQRYIYLPIPIDSVEEWRAQGAIRKQWSTIQTCLNKSTAIETMLQI